MWETEILRLLYDENLLGDMSVAFKGGTALSKCWKAIERFSEDIDLSIHWYDVDCLLQAKFANPLSSQQAMNDVVEMKTHRWAEKGVDYHLASSGGLKLVPGEERLQGIAKDHQDAIDGGMFFSTPDAFDVIVERIRKTQDEINASANKSSRQR